MRLRPAPSIMLETVKMWWSKTIIRSRTIAVGVIAIITFILNKVLGLENVDFSSVVDLVDGLQVSEIGAMIAIVAMIFLRRFIKTDLSTPGVGGANG